MTFSSFPVPVPPILAADIREIAIQTDGSVAPHRAVPYTVYPAPFPVLGFQYRGRISVLRGAMEEPLDSSGITGVLSSLRRFRSHDRTCSVLMTFEPHGAHALFGWPMHEVADTHAGLGDLLRSSTARELENRVAEAPTIGEATSVVVSYFENLSRYSRREPHPVVVRATKILLAAHGWLSIDALADDLGISSRQLERLFQEQIGVGPKRFASLSRFDWARELIERGIPAATVAVEAGYADQAHLTREFVVRAGVTPRRYPAGTR